MLSSLVTGSLAWLGGAHDAAREASAAADARRSEVGEALDVALEAEVTLVDSAVQCQRRRAEAAEATSEGEGEGEGEAAADGGEGAARRLQLRGARLRGRLHALKAAQAELATTAEPEMPGGAETEAEVEDGHAADRTADAGGLKRQRRAEAGAEHDAAPN